MSKDDKLTEQRRIISKIFSSNKCHWAQVNSSRCCIFHFTFQILQGFRHLTLNPYSINNFGLHFLIIYYL